MHICHYRFSVLCKKNGTPRPWLRRELRSGESYCRVSIGFFCVGPMKQCTYLRELKVTGRTGNGFREPVCPLWSHCGRVSMQKATLNFDARLW